MKDSYFGEFGGCFVPELLMPPLMEVEAAMRDIYPTEKFQAELKDLLRSLHQKKRYHRLRDGRLADIAPTMLDLMGLEKPKEMDGETLIVN